jgi:hypothetical protein
MDTKIKMKSDTTLNNSKKVMNDSKSITVASLANKM